MDDKERDDPGTDAGSSKVNFHETHRKSSLNVMLLILYYIIYIDVG